LQRLADPGHVSVPKDPQHSGEERMLAAIPFHMLLLQELDKRLSHRHAPRLHARSPNQNGLPAPSFHAFVFVARSRASPFP
jgi:hypothetical protein